MYRPRSRSLGAGPTPLSKGYARSPFVTLILTLSLSPAWAGTYTVTNLNDSGPGTLRQAIADAQTQPGADTIEFAANLSGDLAITGTLGISGVIDLVGPGADVLTIYGNGSSRTVLYVHSNAEVTISGLSITNGSYGIENQGMLTINECNMFQNYASGIYNNGSNANLTVNDSTLSENAGSGIYSYYATLTVNRSTVDGNSGAGVANRSGISVINDSIISNNRVRGVISHYSGNTIRLNRCTISGNSTTESYGGAGLYSDGATSLTITHSTFVDNTAASGCGGGIKIIGGTDIDFYNNTLSGNLAGWGGGLCIKGAIVLNAFHSTITDNSANNLGGGIYIDDTTPTLMLGNSLVAGNSAPTGSYNPTAGVEMYNEGSFRSKGHNLFGQNGTAGLVDASPDATDLILTGPIGTTIGPLADNGGPTLTHLLLAGSQAINGGDNSLIPQNATTDQRGEARIQNGTVDIGAVEVTSTAVMFGLSVNKVGSGTVSSAGGEISCGSTCTASLTSGTSITLTATPAAGSAFNGWSGACTGTGICTISMTAAKNVTATFGTGAPVGAVDDVVLVQAKSPSTVGAGTGDDNYLISGFLLNGNEQITISDVQGNNFLQLVDGLSIASSSVGASALRLTLSNGTQLTVLGADAFGFDVGGNATLGINYSRVAFSDFAQGVLGVKVPATGTLTGGAVTITAP